MRKAGYLLLLVCLLFGCQAPVDVGVEPTKGDFFLMQEGNNKKSVPVIAAVVSGPNQITPAQPEATLKSFFAYLTTAPISELEFTKLQTTGQYKMRGFDGTTNYYYDLQLLNNSLYLLTSYSGCSGCSYCVMASSTSCSCQNSGSCSFSSGSAK